MLTTNLRFTQTLDPTGVARAENGMRPVTAPAYRICASRVSAPDASALRPTTGLTARTWSSIGLEAMPKVDFHDRWPLHSTS